jgi:hypothetical protein
VGPRGDLDDVEKNILPLLRIEPRFVGRLAKPTELSLPQVSKAQLRIPAQRNRTDRYKGERDANKDYGSDISQDAEVCVVSNKNKSLPSRLLNPFAVPPNPYTEFDFFPALKQ